jgi:hypothetical protein
MDTETSFSWLSIPVAAGGRTHACQKYPKGCIVTGSKRPTLPARPQEFGGLPEPSAPPAAQAAGRDHVTTTVQERLNAGASGPMWRSLHTPRFGL